MVISRRNGILLSNVNPSKKTTRHCFSGCFSIKGRQPGGNCSAMQNNKNYRKETQPYDKPCAGSIFRNPLPQYAGQLVQDAGLKGHVIGGAKISEMHGNFIVNTGEGSAEDVLALIEHVKDTVYEKFGIMLETEVEIIGRK